MFFVFAWSSVAFNLHEEVYWPVMRVFFDMPQEPIATSGPYENEKEVVSWRQGQARGEALMAEQAERYGFIVKKPMALALDREIGTYTWRVRSTLDIPERRGETSIGFDAYTGSLKSVGLPAGQCNVSTVTTWLYALHVANVFGLPYRIFVSVLGLAIVMLSVTGIVIWLKKRGADGRRSVGDSR